MEFDNDGNWITSRQACRGSDNEWVSYISARDVKLVIDNHEKGLPTSQGLSPAQELTREQIATIITNKEDLKKMREYK